MNYRGNGKIPTSRKDIIIENSRQLRSDDKENVLPSRRSTRTRTVSRQLLFNSVSKLSTWFNYQLHQGGCVMAGICLSLSGCSFICLLTILCKNYWLHLHENFTTDKTFHKEVPVKFWKPSRYKVQLHIWTPDIDCVSWPEMCWWRSAVCTLCFGCFISLPLHAVVTCNVISNVNKWLLFLGYSWVWDIVKKATEKSYWWWNTST